MARAAKSCVKLLAAAETFNPPVPESSVQTVHEPDGKHLQNRAFFFWHERREVQSVRKTRLCPFVSCGFRWRNAASLFLYFYYFIIFFFSTKQHKFY